MQRFVVTLLAILASASPGNAAPAPAPVPDAIPIAMLVDLSSGQVLFARNADRRFVPASIAKAMTVYAAFDLMERGKLKPEQVFTFSETTARDWRRTGSTMFLEPGQAVSVHELLMGITTVSANDGSVVLGEGVAGSLEGWVAVMNGKARALGMTQTHFGNPNGFPDGARTFTTARDLVTLGRALTTEHAPLYRRYFGHRGLRTNGFAQDNHDPLSGVVDGADGIKTGFTAQAGFGFLGSAIRGDRRLVMVVAGAPEESLRDETARALMEWGFSGFRSAALFAAGERVAAARVQDGEAAEVALATPQAVRFSVPVGTAGKVSLSVVYDGPLRAPVAKGETVAELVISAAGMPPSRVPLVAAESVAKAGFLRRIANGLRGLVE
ncbi:D-alanyl-D-alanine carboxypeptidase family protein [Parerythrobacter aurantius]|uniref:D-alanyl-D-alanine carboxypeptidase family protein n=1 Tax=Parerythrobacter aurantius TaxID=3127706 RepID=UPI0032455DA1